MKVYRLLPVALLALFAGCSGDSLSTLVPSTPHAAVRWMNAVPDTMPMDYRIVDVVTNANEASVAYGGTSGAYRSVPPGQHHIRVFPASTVAAACNGPDVVSKVLLDTTVTFAVNHYYTMLHAGYMKAGASPSQRLIVTDDVFPAATAGHISLRVASGFGTATDVFMLAAADTGTAIVAPAAYPNLGFGTVTPYASIATAATPPTGMSYRISAAAAGTTTPRLANGLLPVGTPAYAGSTSVPPLDPVGGSEQDGSVLTTVVLPTAVSYTLTSSGTASNCPAAGVKTVVAAGKTGLVVTLVDKNPKDPVLGQ